MDHSQRAIVIVDDDQDDLDIIEEAYKELGLKNNLILLNNGAKLEEYLKENEAPFFILCDYVMPQINGVELRSKVLNDPINRYKSVPFLLWSTSANESQIKTAYDTLIQGFFIKPTSYEEIRDTLKSIVDYWSRSQHPKDNRPLS